MPKVKAKVLATKITQDGKMLAKIQLNGKLPREGESITVQWGSNRNLSQNALYWAYLTYVINECGLKEQGHFSAEGLHYDLKAHFKEESTAVMNKMEFGEYLDKVDMFLVSFFGLDTSLFWVEVKNNSEYH